MADSPSRLAFALEYSLGHVTHAENIKRTLKSRPDIDPVYADLRYEGMTGAWTRLPGIRSNWTLRASLGAWLALRGQRDLQGAFFHTQVTSLFCPGLMRRVPSVISLDATPLQYDALGAFYGHAPSANPRLENLKKRLNQRAFAAARHLVTWSHWTKDSLTADYGVPAEKITVIPPGVDQTLFLPDPAARPNDGVVRILFVGGNFARKGGELLLRWARETSVATPWNCIWRPATRCRMFPASSRITTWPTTARSWCVCISNATFLFCRHWRTVFPWSPWRPCPAACRSSPPVPAAFPTLSRRGRPAFCWNPAIIRRWRGIWMNG